MGLFDIFKRKSDAPDTKGAQPTQPVAEPKIVPPPAAPTEVSWTQLPKDITDVWAAFAQEHASAKARGLQLLVYTFEPWSAGSLAMRKFCKDPLALSVLGEWHVVEIGMGAMELMNDTPEFKARGLSATLVPQLWTFDANGRIEGFSISGGYWGADTPENIANGFKRWFENRAQL